MCLHTLLWCKKPTVFGVTVYAMPALISHASGFCGLYCIVCARHVGEKCMYKTFHSYFTDMNCKLYTRNRRWQGVVEYLEVSDCKFWPIVRVERGLTLGGRFWPTRSSSDCST